MISEGEPEIIEWFIGIRAWSTPALKRLFRDNMRTMRKMETIT